MKQYAIHLGLFLATCATTTLAVGPAFSVTLMAILVCHEMGHYVVARRHGIDASLPYFIPMPPVITLGTLGAVIRMKSPIEDPNKLVDVGAAGPLAGLAVAIPALFYGLTLSDVGPPTEGGMLEGNSIAYLAIKYAVKGMYLPSDGVDVNLHPVAFAAWVGLLITMINLIPIGQLDGGHIACGYLRDRHEGSSRYLHYGLLVVGLAVFGWMTNDALGAGYTTGDAAVYGVSSAAPWLVWAGMLAWMRSGGGGSYHPPVGDVPLTPARRALVFCMGIVFVLIFTPVPLRQGLTP